MYIDLKFSESKFLGMLRDQVQRALPLVKEEFSFGGNALIVDHLEVTDLQFTETGPSVANPIATPSGMQNIASPGVRVQITIDAKTTTRNAAKAAGHFGVPKIMFAPKLLLLADIAVTANGGAMVLVMTVTDVSDNLNVLTPEQKEAIKEQIPPQARNIALPAIAGHALTVTNAGVARAAGAFAIRAQISSPDVATAKEWKAFFAGNFTAPAGDWSILLPKDLMVEVVDGFLTDTVNGIPAKEPSAEVVLPPDTSWMGGGIVSHSQLNLVDRCGPKDVAFDLDFAVVFSMGSDGAVQVDVNVTWNLDDGDIAACAAMMVVVPGLLVTLVAGALGGPIGALVGLVITIIGFLVAVVKISDMAHGQLADHASGVDPGALGLHTVEEDDAHVLLRGSVKLDGFLTGMTATSVTGTLEGLLLGGTLSVPEHHERSLNSVGKTTFEWDAGYSCSAKAWQCYPVDATLSFSETNHYPLEAMVEVLSPAGSYMTSLDYWGSATVTDGCTVHAYSQLEGGPKDPNCELIIRTNSGVRYVNLGRLPAKPEKPGALELQKNKGGCFKQALPPVKKWLEAHWLIDPGPDATPVEHVRLWDLAVSDLPAGATVEVAVVSARQQARVVHTMRASRNGTAAFRLATGPGEHVAVHVDKGIGNVTLSATGAVLDCVARFAPWGGAVDATVVGAGARARVVLATRDQVLLLGLDSRLVTRLAAPGVRSVVGLGSSAVVHDGAKVSTINLPIARTAAVGTTRVLQEGIKAMEARGNVLSLALANGKFARLDRNLTEVPPANINASASWRAEPWMGAPIVVGGYFVRVKNGVAYVYRCSRRKAF